MPDSAVVHINRPKKYFASLCKIDVYLDGQKLATLANGKSVSIDIAPDMHTLHCQYGKHPSETIKWEAIEGKQLQLECEFVGWEMKGVYCGAALALVLCFIYGYGLWGLHWLYSRDINQIFTLLCVFVQLSGYMWSLYLADKQRGMQGVRLWPSPMMSQPVGQLIPSPVKQQHRHLLLFISLPFVVAILMAIFVDFYMYVVLPAIFP
jgi:hypothetical protein